MLLRSILLVHRYLAVAVGLLVALWCLSGFVMMYQSFPWFTPEERLRTLAPLELDGCCRTDFLTEDAEPLQGFRIEMLLGEPVLRQNGATPMQLRTGAPQKPLTQAQLLEVAGQFARGRELSAEAAWVGEVEVDQWSIQGAAQNRPAHHLALHDADRSEIYINGATGEIFQDTTRRERVLSWLGAIPHWLYFTGLRSNGPLWSQVVIWTAVLGTFLTATGLYVGISRLQRRDKADRSVSPFRGWWYWHHLLGLVFGVLALTWVFSGLLTMNPWGLLDSDGGAAIRPQLRGEATNSELRRFLQAAPSQLAGGEFAQLQGEVRDGKLQVIARRADGSTLRLDADAKPDPLDAATLERWVRGLPTGLRSFERLEATDAYYYGHKSGATLPVYRAILDDPGRTRLYIDPSTGALRVVDTQVRRSRWLIGALHSLDLRGLRVRPIWDIAVWLFLAGVTALAITGSWMALKRIRADLSLMISPWRR
jgi:uncharacterized iron-regulated membrane protein